MLAVDTNVVVRLLIEDDPAQVMRVRSLFVESDIFVPLPVVLETEWILRRVYRLEVAEVVGGFRRLAGLPTVTIEEYRRFANALELAEDGMDFADALHLASMPEGATFVTFDRDLRRKAARRGLSVTEP